MPHIVRRTQPGARGKVFTTRTFNETVRTSINYNNDLCLATS